MAEALKNQEEHRILLHNASWETYERLLAEREERRSPRFFYERGALEILSPSAEHDMTSRIVATLIELLAEEADTDVESSGSTTFKREDLARGFEPDECFYFGGNASRVRDTVAGKGNIELDAGDPAPDLVVEVYITSPSFDKLSIYARLGVHEVWRYAETPDGWRSSGWRTSAKAAKSRVTPKRRRAPTCRGSP
ncbi:MAG TPA: Uma2 family endonuclease [Rubrobacteraceae bacterium]|nr:Uma2 family endonuclease [Rubrobacteraceae bacterium]